MLTISEVLEQDRLIADLCAHIEAGNLDDVDALCREWSSHALRDDAVVYPQLAEWVVHYEAQLARAHADHRLIGRLIGQLTTSGDPRSGGGNRPDADDRSYAGQSGLLARLVREHIVSEERTVLRTLMLAPTRGDQM